MSACQLQCSLNRFRAGVRKEGAIEAGALHEQSCELCLPFVIEEIRSVNQLTAFIDDRPLNRRMAVAQRIDADAAEQVEIMLAILVNDVYAFAAHKENWVAVICVQQQFALSSFNLFQFRHFSIAPLRDHDFRTVGHARACQIGKGTGSLGGQNTYTLHTVKSA